MIRKIQNLAKVQFYKENASPLKRLIWSGGLFWVNSQKLKVYAIINGMNNVFPNP